MPISASLFLVRLWTPHVAIQTWTTLKCNSKAVLEVGGEKYTLELSKCFSDTLSAVSEPRNKRKGERPVGSLGPLLEASGAARSHKP